MVLNEPLRGFAETGKILKEKETNKVKSIRNTASVGTISTPIAHGLGRTPKLVLAFPRANGSVWEASPPDNTNIYLQASVTNLQVYWMVE